MQSGGRSHNNMLNEVPRNKAGEGAQEDFYASSHMEANSNGNKNSREQPLVFSRRTEQKRRERARDKFKWEESSSQIYRLTLSNTHLTGRLYFAEYNEMVMYAAIGIANILANQGLLYASHVLRMGIDEKGGRYDVVPFLMGWFAVVKVLWLLAQASWHGSATSILEVSWSFLVGLAGFIVALCLLLFASSCIFDYGMETLFSISMKQPVPSVGNERQDLGFFMLSPTLTKVIIAAIAGFIIGILVTPSHRTARSFWLGTDQLQWNIPMTKQGVIARFLLYVNIALPLFASVLWIKPMVSLLVTTKVSKQAGPYQGQSSGAEGNTGGVQFWGSLVLPLPSDVWTQDFLIPSEVFIKFQFWLLFVSGLLHLALFRVHVQTYLNEALIVWYESLHRSKIMNLELVRAQLLLNSYLLCRAALQYLVPGVLVILLLGISRVRGDLPLQDLAQTNPNWFFLKVVTMFLAWWVTCSWSFLTCIILGLYRTGFLLAS
ncbi:hypothetical protein KP509_23G009900 [Ceratopteris richardii]|nr:hypothetical protein KP509_23G009900 [Ceratopteris richardii]